MRRCDPLRNKPNSYACFTFRWDFWWFSFWLFCSRSVGRSTFSTVKSWMAYFLHKRCNCGCVGFVSVLECGRPKFALFTLISNRYSISIARGLSTGCVIQYKIIKFICSHRFGSTSTFWMHCITNQLHITDQIFVSLWVFIAVHTM